MHFISYCASSSGLKTGLIFDPYHQTLQIWSLEHCQVFSTGCLMVLINLKYRYLSTHALRHWLKWHHQRQLIRFDTTPSGTTKDSMQLFGHSSTPINRLCIQTDVFVAQTNQCPNYIVYLQWLQSPLASKRGFSYIINHTTTVLQLPLVDVEIMNFKWRFQFMLSKQTKVISERSKTPAVQFLLTHDWVTFVHVVFHPNKNK